VDCVERVLCGDVPAEEAHCLDAGKDQPSAGPASGTGEQPEPERHEEDAVGRTQGEADCRTERPENQPMGLTLVPKM